MDDPRLKAVRLARIARNVGDVSRSMAFYRDALGFQVIQERLRTARLRLGSQEIELAECDPQGAPYPADSSSCDLWFQHIAIVASNMAAAHARLSAHGGFTPITRGGPVTLPPSSGGVTAFKFRDPDGHPLELIHFPPGTGDPAWQQGNADAPTIGIDHSALSISDPAASIGFYTGVLGLALASQRVNTGPEQDALDALAGVKVDVIALRPVQTGTPHVELLGYRVPRGRALASPMRPNDIAADRLILEVERNAGSGSVLVRDPDGHLAVVTEPAKSD